MSTAQEFSILEELRWFMKNRVVFTAAELNIFDIIEAGEARDAEALARLKGVNSRGLTRLLDCLVGLGYLEKKDGEYSVTEKGSYLTSKHPRTILPMVLHNAHLWKNWTHLTDTVTLGSNPRRIPVMADEFSRNAFIRAMHVIARSLAEDVVGSYDASDRSVLLDIGAGPGTYTIAFLRKYPHMRAIVFDLPEVIPLSREYIASEKLEDRVSFVAGDFYHDLLPEGSDLALLSAIIHQNSPEENLALYRSVNRALKPGGKLLIRDHIMSDDRVWPPDGALFAINMLVSTPGGDTYTFSEVEKTLKAAGFRDVRLVRKGPKMDCLVEAVKA
ncbi:methyltransferase [Thermodesulforhabdus norvegica]|uniref:Ubiquinone/menaquinone biosynthesis C-methylase UbiE n=1 Tax=Thermodesulforhabdus norvegica TaxID=39841 RepID=A0A1I4VS18_9BACT|nr:methyltransferase [Thermodesulforhabdus norvegica]SFN03887.1 Ubiquinone/menaquinone biosynthesis C-methylase UbiE [Thermodesulforhabdus norvegica]